MNNKIRVLNEYVNDSMMYSNISLQTYIDIRAKVGYDVIERTLSMYLCMDEKLARHVSFYRYFKLLHTYESDYVLRILNEYNDNYYLLKNMEFQYFITMRNNSSLEEIFEINESYL